MLRDPRTYLFDVRQAADLIVSFAAGRNLDDYLSDQMLRSAVERQFTIIGEALTQLSRYDAAPSPHGSATISASSPSATS